VGQRYVDYWMAHGMSIPGWILVRMELSAEAKLVYGVLSATVMAEDYPKLDLGSLALYTGLVVADTQAALEQLQEFTLVIVDPDDSLRLPTHSWADAIYYESDNE
jgi:hypothetical protein